MPYNLAYWFMTTMPFFAIPFFAAGFLSIMTYVVPVLLQNFYFDRNHVDLKKKYNATWAMVTGASSGIGLAIVHKLAGQGINVVLVALDQPILTEALEDCKKKYPKLAFRRIGVDLSQGDYMTPIINGCQDIDINLVFNNAGFITTGFFADTPLARIMGNYECNATCAVKITHYFLARMTAAKRVGLIAFTSSSAGFVPNPLSSMYASTKAFLTMFATSIAPEVKKQGIDVVVVHPSPMATNFFDNAGGLSTLIAFKRFAASPSVIADVIFDSAGRFVVRDQGLVSIIFRVFLKFIDGNFFSEMVARFSHMSADYKALIAKKEAKQE